MGNLGQVEADTLDSTTGIPDKDTFYRNARKLLDANPEIEYDFITSDIEHFKVINDVYGYEKGDELLRFSAQKIQEACGFVGGICGRYFADIFMSVVPRREGLIEIISEMTEKNIEEGPIKPSPKVKFGLYPITDRSLPISAMYDRSMLALSSVRGHERVNFAIYDEGQRESIIREQFIINHIDKALADNEIIIYLQPKYSLETRTINGAEALVRWISPEEGFMSPAEFIPILETRGEIFKLDLHVWELACQAIRRWLDKDMPIVPISVNVSRIDMDDPEFESKLLALVEKYEVPIEYFNLEITETTYANLNQSHISLIEGLRKKGFRVEMDDFGSGYSSLNMLKDFYIDDLKIDLGFLTDFGKNNRSEKILRLVVDLAKDLELGIVAEGVEEAQQADFLSGIGCETAQGYYFAKPMPLEEFEKFLAEDQAR